MDGSPLREPRANLRVRELVLQLPECEVEGETSVEVPVTHRVA